MGKMRDPDKENTKGTKYSPKLAKAIAKVNKASFDRSLAGRLQSAAINRIQGGENKQVTPTAASIKATGLLMQNNRDTLLGQAKSNSLDSAGLNKLATANRELGFNETTGMGIKESLQYQATRPEMKRDLKKTADRIRKLPTITNVLLGALGGKQEKLSD